MYISYLTSFTEVGQVVIKEERMLKQIVDSRWGMTDRLQTSTDAPDNPFSAKITMH